MNELNKGFTKMCLDYDRLEGDFPSRHEVRKSSELYEIQKTAKFSTQSLEVSEELNPPRH